MFGEQVWATLEYENAMTMRAIVVEKLLGDRAPEASSAENDDVERPGVVLRRFVRPRPVGICAAECFVQTITGCSGRLRRY